MLTRRHLLALGGGLGGALLPVAAFAEDAGEVSALTGNAVAVAGGAERTLATGATVKVNDLVQTGADGRLGLRLGKSTSIQLGPGTKLRIEQHLADVGGQFELLEGSMLFEHTRAPGAPAHKADVKGPYGLIAVRGTRFFAGPSRGRFGVYVTEGRVDVAAAGRTVVLVPGYGTEMARPGDIPVRPSVWSAGRAREALALVTGPAQPRGR